MQLRRAGLASCAGFMLVEVLVAMLLASVAVVALAGAHAAALRLTRISEHRVQAALLAADLLERLRAHASDTAGAAEPGAYHLNLSWAAQQGDAGSPLATACDGAAAHCTALEFARADAAHWQGGLRRSLPGAAAWVQVDPAWNLVDVWVAWRDPLAPAADEVAQPASECPAGLEVPADAGIRCLHARGSW